MLKLQKLAAAWAVTRYLEAVHWAKTGTLSQTYRIRLHQLYSKEVEHDGENEATLEEACLSNLAFSPGVSPEPHLTCIFCLRLTTLLQYHTLSVK